MIYVGIAGWALPTVHKGLFPEEGSHLERYASVFNCVEINSAFHKTHKAATYEKWRAMVPKEFRFSVKLSKVFTHQKKLQASGQELADTLGPILELKEKMGALLIQIPPKLTFNEDLARDFFEAVRESYTGPIAFEPRHLSWTTRDAISVYKDFDLTKVIADPSPCPLDLTNSRLTYFRMHGSPKMYRSNYSKKFLKDLAGDMKAQKSKNTWCIFDNTAEYHATVNGIDLLKLLKK